MAERREVDWTPRMLSGKARAGPSPGELLGPRGRVGEVSHKGHTPPPSRPDPARCLFARGEARPRAGTQQLPSCCRSWEAPRQPRAQHAALRDFAGGILPPVTGPARGEGTRIAAERAHVATGGVVRFKGQRARLVLPAWRRGCCCAPRAPPPRARATLSHESRGRAMRSSRGVAAQAPRAAPGAGGPRGGRRRAGGLAAASFGGRRTVRRARPVGAAHPSRWIAQAVGRTRAWCAGHGSLGRARAASLRPGLRRRQSCWRQGAANGPPPLPDPLTPIQAPTLSTRSRRGD